MKKLKCGKNSKTESTYLKNSKKEGVNRLWQR